ncbi:MAG: response regulator [Polyangiales bacterium]
MIRYSIDALRKVRSKLTFSEDAGRERHWRILLVEDDRDTALLLGSFLERAGHEVHLAADPEEAIRELVTHWPEVVIVDIGLPVMDGYELAERIRAVAHCKLIAISGYSADSARPATAVSSFDRHLVKPVDHDTLLRTLHAL